ncbi:MAG: SDR family oxidoreductase [Betaproteobacteria bacterium]|nr:SDR family oxidoreductase [Betaproteobacteria bacterium]
MSGPVRRHALVTGAGRGIGAAIAHALAADGWTLTLAGRDSAALAATCAALSHSGPGGHGWVSMDVTDAESVAKGVTEARAARGAFAALVNNAGAVETAAFARTDAALWRRMLEVNLTGAFTCTQAVLPDLVSAQDARIVNVASTAALKGYAYVSAYCAAKHGLLGLTRALAQELASRGVTVNAVCPGYTDTDIVHHAIQNITEKTGRSAEEARQSLVQGNPTGRLVQPVEVAEAVRWLCSPLAASVNGQAIAVCGGETN